MFSPLSHRSTQECPSLQPSFVSCDHFPPPVNSHSLGRRSSGSRGIVRKSQIHLDSMHGAGATVDHTSFPTATSHWSPLLLVTTSRVAALPHPLTSLWTNAVEVRRLDLIRPADSSLHNARDYPVRSFYVSLSKASVLLLSEETSTWLPAHGNFLPCREAIKIRHRTHLASFKGQIFLVRCRSPLHPYSFSPPSNVSCIACSPGRGHSRIQLELKRAMHNGRKERGKRLSSRGMKYTPRALNSPTQRSLKPRLTLALRSRHGSPADGVCALSGWRVCTEVRLISSATHIG